MAGVTTWTVFVQLSGELLFLCEASRPAEIGRGTENTTKLEIEPCGTVTAMGTTVNVPDSGSLSRQICKTRCQRITNRQPPTQRLSP
jgi:hypothetical protein